MHRHGYKGRKFGRETDQRRALIKGLATSLVEHGAIETTIHKAKEVVPYVETLITKAKKGDLHNRRQVISGLLTQETAHKLVDEIAPKLTTRDSGHLRIVRTKTRVGDNAQLAKVSFVDEVYGTDKQVVAAKKETTKAESAEQPKAKSEGVKASTPKVMKAADKHLSHKPTVTVRKSGER